jgi:hypothetical protein
MKSNIWIKLLSVPMVIVLVVVVIGYSPKAYQPILTTTATLNFGNTGPGASSDLTITVTGAAANDAVLIGVPNGSIVTTGCFTGWVSASNTVTIRFTNSDGILSYDPASGTFRASVLKQ